MILKSYFSKLTFLGILTFSISCKTKTEITKTENTVVKPVETKSNDVKEISEDTKITEEKNIIKLVENKEKTESTLIYPTWEGCPDGNKVCFQRNLMMHIKKSFFYPQEAKDAGAQERIFVTFEYDEKGVLDQNSIQAIRGNNKFLKAAAIKMISSLPKLKAPAFENGKPKVMKYTIPIIFRLQ
ncbi:MAG: energy transducer TonB [Flavobacteriales bacterium]